jgi:hypothetical protein
MFNQPTFTMVLKPRLASKHHRPHTHDETTHEHRGNYVMSLFFVGMPNGIYAI